MLSTVLVVVVMVQLDMITVEVKGEFRAIKVTNLKNSKLDTVRGLRKRLIKLKMWKKKKKLQFQRSDLSFPQDCGMKRRLTAGTKSRSGDKSITFGSSLLTSYRRSSRDWAPGTARSVNKEHAFLTATPKSICLPSTEAGLNMVPGTDRMDPNRLQKI